MSNRIVKSHYKEYLRKVSEENIENYKKSQKEKDFPKSEEENKQEDK